MKHMHMYFKDDFQIKRYNILLNETDIIFLIKSLDNYYDNKGEIKKSYGHLPFSDAISGRTIEIRSLAGTTEHKRKLVDLTNSPYLIYEYYDFNPIRLSAILRKIINAQNSFKLSYAINELQMFIPKDDVENKFYIEALKKIKFICSKSKFDIIGNFLSKTYNLENNDAEINYIDDSIIKCINKFPYKK